MRTLACLGGSAARRVGSEVPYRILEPIDTVGVARSDTPAFEPRGNIKIQESDA